MMNGAKTGVALAGGYLLGRTRKAKLAIGLGMYLAGRKLDLNPQAIKKLISESAVLGSLNSQIREEVLGATKSAISGTLTKRVNGFTDSLHERALDLGRLPAGADDAAEDDGPAEDREDGGAAGKSQDEDRPSGGSATRKRGSGTASSRRRSPTGSRAKGKQPASTPRGSAATSRKTASAGGKAAARATSERGGRNA